MSDKKPQPGEFWEWAGERLRIIGTRNDGRFVGENQAGGLEISCHIFDMTHIAECDSFEWQPKPVESPDDWVTQDRVPAREAIDQRRFLYPRRLIGEWQAVGKYSKGMMHKSLAEGDTVELRCRRRDLPPMPPMPQQTPKREYVRLWIHRTSGTVCAATGGRYPKYPDIWTELKHDGTGFYLEDGK